VAAKRRRDITIIQDELPLDIIEFFCLTPLPGSEDHQALWKKGVAMDPDLNNYDAEHVCTAHPNMSRGEWEGVYREAWSQYYTPKHLETLLRRAAATSVPIVSLIKILVSFATTVRLENVHPLQRGLVRLKHPSERRPGLPRESACTFWPRLVWEAICKHTVIIGMISRLLLLSLAISRDPAAKSYMDPALMPGVIASSLGKMPTTSVRRSTFEEWPKVVRRPGSSRRREEPSEMRRETRQNSFICVWPPFRRPNHTYIALDPIRRVALIQPRSAIAVGRASGGDFMDSDTARRRAEASFKKEERARDGAKAMFEYEAESRATQEKTARLRALRLAKEAADEEQSQKSRAR
jgi:hypothetical protein